MTEKDRRELLQAREKLELNQKYLAEKRGKQSPKMELKYKLQPLIYYVSENGPEKAREHLELAIQILCV